MWIGRIFTAISFSPSSLSRQRSTRYVFRAGCLLSTEEFRYLRTVRVTAAIHQYLGQRLLPINWRPPPSVIFWHWADVSMYVSTCVFAHTCVLVKQSIEPFHCDPMHFCIGRPFSRTYGANLPNSLRRINSYTLEFSSSSPVAVSGTVTYISHIEDFPADWILTIALPLKVKLCVTTRVKTESRIYQTLLPYCLHADLSTP